MSVSVLLFARYFEPAFRGGGPIQTLVALLRAKPATIDTAVICSNQDLGDPSPVVSEPDVWLEREVSRVRYCGHGLRRFVVALRSSRRFAPRLIYVNSFFDVTYSLLPQLAARLGVWRGASVVLAPRGELYEGALKMKAVKKQVLIGVYRALGLHRRVIWHASTEDEANSIRAVFGQRVRIEVRENETSLPLTAVDKGARDPGPLRLVFASRAAEKKGLLTLLEGLSLCTGRVDLEIVGAFEDRQYEEACRSVVARMPTNIVVSMSGAMQREELIDRLRGSDAMALPTLGENFGHVIAEALSVSCPVLCSSETPWTGRLAAGGGVVVSPNVPAEWARHIDVLAQEGPTEWAARSRGAARVYREWRTASKGEHIFQRALSTRAQR